MTRSAPQGRGGDQPSAAGQGDDQPSAAPDGSGGPSAAAQGSDGPSAAPNGSGGPSTAGLGSNGPSSQHQPVGQAAYEHPELFPAHGDDQFLSLAEQLDRRVRRFDPEVTDAFMALKQAVEDLCSVSYDTQHIMRTAGISREVRRRWYFNWMNAWNDIVAMNINDKFNRLDVIAIRKQR